MKLFKTILITLFAIAPQACNSTTPSGKDSSEIMANFAGTGCSASSTKVATDEKSKMITLQTLLPSYEAGETSSSAKKRVACSFAIPIKIPKGFQISHLEADWKGYIKGEGVFSRKYFLAGQPTSSWIRSRYNEPKGSNFQQQDNIPHADLKTSCDGGSYNLRINSDIKTKDSNSYITLAKEHKIKISLHLKSCK